MKIPKRIKIGAQRLNIIIKEEVSADGVRVLGLSLPGAGVIELSAMCGGKPCPEDSMTDTLLHEIVHVASLTYGLGLSEKQVSGLAGALLQVIRDNNLDFSDRGR